MIKERIKEVFEFTKSESPYRKANKGWINQDIFLDLNPSPDTYKQTNEAAKIILFWSPINSLLSNIFILLFLSSILVFTSISFVKGRFDFNLFNNSGINEIVNINENKALTISNAKDVDSTKLKTQQNTEKKDLDQSNQINTLDDVSKKIDENTTTQKIDSQDNSVKEIESTKDIKNLESKKTKSNFI